MKQNHYFDQNNSSFEHKNMQKKTQKVINMNQIFGRIYFENSKIGPVKSEVEYRKCNETTERIQFESNFGPILCWKIMILVKKYQFLSSKTCNKKKP